MTVRGRLESLNDSIKTLIQRFCVLFFACLGSQAPPIAIAGHDVIVQPGVTVTLDGIESRALGDAHIVNYKWTRVSGDNDVQLKVKREGSGLAQVKAGLPVVDTE